MKNARSGKYAIRDFVSSSPHYWPMLDRSFKNLFFGFLMFFPGLYLATIDLPGTPSYLAQIRVGGLPMAVGGICVIFGCIGFATGVMGTFRKRENAIDLKISAKGLTVRGGHEIPWDSISHVTSIQYHNHAAIQAIWDRADLNSAFVVHLKEPLGIPRLKTKAGIPQLKIKLFRYPALDYKPLYDWVGTEFERRHIPVDMKWKTKET
ncbi:hypothetical protein [Arthrobacter glacialis]|uniref:Uncharacterized protein n=1 Tax=Arthrobacter glacialis TaxID=1664 RepID=A0A2S3ZSP7_ARTGL|nr:hypothetical protein [Arthrobacter glacialis]POH56968.1 hypothetical protein CVS28_17990 [Arthrobacter glacialis]POH72022.1 hypothetical protein CVS27_17715 [Arthrobacter glacialis]